MIICPNFSNPDVAREFNELKEATSEKAAYAIWSLNNGNPIDRAPNGAPSNLFLYATDATGDRVKAIQAKSRIYMSSWNDVYEGKDIKDSNGEPIILNHKDYDVLRKTVTDILNNIPASYVKSTAERIAKSIGLKKLNYFRDENGKIWVKKNSFPQPTGRDIIQRSISRDKVRNIILFLNSRFGDQIEVVYHSKEEYKRIRSHSEVDLKSSGFVEYTNNKFVVHMNTDLITDESAIEEILHPFVWTLSRQNPDLFEELLTFANENFKDLVNEINHLYDSNQDLEIVTQTLSRYFLNQFEQEKHKSFKEIAHKFLEFLGGLFNDILPLKIKNKYFISKDLLSKLKNKGGKTDFERLSELLNTADTYIELLQFDQTVTVLNHLSTPLQDELDKSITRQMYDTGVQIETERSQFITQVLNRYKKDNPDASQQDLSKVINGARHTFDTDRCNDLLKQKQQFLAQQFSLIIDRDGYYKSGETTQKKVMLEHFINSLQNDTFKAYQLHNIGKGKYLLVGSVLNAHSVANVLYNALYEGDLTTLDKEIARDYVRMFWGSDLIQAALDVLNAPNKTSQQLEDELVNRMTSVPAEQRDTNIVQWFKNFWNSLNQLVKTVFGKHTFTDQQKDDILKAVDAAFMLAEDLDIVNEDKILLDRMDGDFDSSYLLSDTDKTAFSSIYQGIQTRIKSQQSRKERKTNLIADLKTSKEKIEARDSESIKDTYETIKEFLIAANKEIGEIRYYIDKTLIGVDMHQWNPYEINFIQQDLIGYYSNLLQVINDMFADPKSSVSVYNKILVDKEGVLDLKQLQLQLQRTINSLQKGYNNSIVLPYVRMVLTDYANENKDIIKDIDSFVYNMNRWLEQDQSCGDLAAGEVLVGMASRSKSPIVRIVEKMVSDAEFDTNREVLRKGHELVRLFNKIRPTGSLVSPYNWQKRFMEFDRDGIPTGYFIRDINYGQFYRDKDAKEEELRKKYELDVDEDGNTIFTDKDLTAKDSVYNKYYDELDKWLCDHCERRYTLEYYKAKRRFLSPKTLQAQNQIQRQIDLLLDKARLSSGLVDLSKLTVNERRLLDIYRREKRDLGSHYIFTEDNNGIVHVQEKSAEGLKMADEISAWNKYIADKVKYKPDWTAFNKAKQELIDSGASQEEIDAFERNNTTMRITPEFYDLLRKVVGKGASNPELEALKKRHSEILNALKNRQGAGSHELAKLGLGLNTDTSGWLELQRLEQRMADIRRDLKRRGIKGEPGEIDSLTFDQIAKMMPVVVGDEDSTHYLDYLIEKWREAAASNTNLTNVFNSMFMYTDEKGTLRYLNAFKYLSPTNFSINVNGTVIKCIETLPGSEYSELDESSPFVNENFIKDGPSMQAKKSMYKNEDFYNLTTDEKTFLDKMIETMSEANDMIPIKSLNRDYLLPQISGRTMTVMSNSIQAKEWSTALKYPLRKFGVTYAETDTDVSTNVDLARRPDGTVVNNIPIRFIEKLKNPLAQTTDVLGSVIMYYDMATNYKNKSKNISTLELIKYAVNPDISTTEAKKLTSQYKKIENILDQRYYGKETSFGFDSNEKITPSKQSTIQATKTIRNIAAVAMLGVNFTTIEVGYIDAMCSMFADAIGGKYITTSDMRYAFAKCIAHTGKVLNGLGRPDVDDKLVAAMQYNQLSRSNSEIFSSLDKFKLDKFIHDHLLMGGYTLTDYMVNGMMLMATYHHYRLIENPETGKKQFYSKSDAINQFTKLGYTEKQAIKLWKKSRVTLWDAYDNVKGDFVLKDEYKDIVTKKLENRISGRLRDRTAMYNGIVPQTEKAKLQQNVFGSFVTLMRNFYINTYWDRFKTGADFVAKDDDHTITWKSEYQRDDLGLVNFETGEFEGAVFKDFARGMYKLTSNAKRVLTHKDLNKLTREQKYAVNRSVVELLQIGTLLFAMLWSIAFARANNYDDDKDPAWLLNLTGDNIGLHFKYDNMWEKFLDWTRWKLALLSTRGFIERLTSWWAPTALEPINDPTVAMSYMDDVGSMWGLVIDLFSQRTGEEIKSDGYKHMTRGTRDILKLLSFIGVDNLVRSWHTDGIKSTLNYYRGLTPTNAIVPTQEEWNKAHGLGKHGAKRKDNKTKKTSENDVEYVY